MKKAFCTFADSRLRKSLRRIYDQAEGIDVYDEIHIFDESDLDPEFRKRFKTKLSHKIRGFGYWVWKPQIILQTLEQMSEGDILNYCDAGCWINSRGKDRLLEYFNMAHSSGMLAFQVKNTFGDEHLEKYSLPMKAWSKGDLFDHFGVRKRTDITECEQIGAGVIFIKNCTTSRQIIKDWLKVYEEDFALTDDSPSKSPNLPGFIEHRHDQSVFGILCKLSGVSTVSAFEYYYPAATPDEKPDWSKLEHYPIWAMRDKKYGLLDMLSNKARNAIARLRQPKRHND